MHLPHGVEQRFATMDTQPNPYQSPTAPPPSLTDRTSWRLYFELLSFVAFVFPLGQIFGPMVLWLVKKDAIQEVDTEGKRVLNFNISWTIWGLLTCGLGFVVWFVIALVATLKAANREPFTHPLTIDFLK